MTFMAINPATGEAIATYAETSSGQVARIIERAHQAHLGWRGEPGAERAARLTALGALLRERAHDYGQLMTVEMGKPLAQAVAEAEKCGWVCDYYAENAERFLAPVPAPTDATTSYWVHRPLGVVLGIMPWNFPFWQVVRFAAPAITAGNAILLKHAPCVPGCAEALETLFADAGYPAGLFANLFIDVEATGEVIDHELVRAVSLTGSVRAGRAVASRAGAAIKKCVLELGGSDPSLVLADADLDAAVASCALGRLFNSGQSCVAAKRFVVVDAIRDAFEQKLTARLEAATMGDPMDAGTELGPLARVDLRDALHDQVQRSVAGGARLVMGGSVPDRPGAWYPATLLADVGSGMVAYQEELFGPVASILPVTDEDEAIKVANDTPYGLGASVYTSDVERGEYIASELLDAGNCFVNGIVKSDPRLPFGGTKESGYGRELSPLGILEFTNTKTVWVK
ncbi:MAG: NAD-dependent succinate-semialdehyde dehydrogenase [Gemmatimonadetes bacterium]|jgi:succinate-semialdehyde dehydrogenase/glutarate-semialdehyde dehydrogenase|nr:NAD-dependent succinate-semialdehyde dehydrogenase [Gemmatimonadota bacterium]